MFSFLIMTLAMGTYSITFNPLSIYSFFPMSYYRWEIHKTQTLWTTLEDVSTVTISRLPKRLKDVLRRCFQNVLEDNLEFGNLLWSISLWNYNRKLFSPSSYNGKMCCGRGGVSLPLFQSFAFKFYMSKLSVHEKSGVFFCLILVRCLVSGYSRESASGSRSGK